MKHSELIIAYGQGKSILTRQIGDEDWLDLKELCQYFWELGSQVMHSFMGLSDCEDWEFKLAESSDVFHLYAVIGNNSHDRSLGENLHHIDGLYKEPSKSKYFTSEEHGFTWLVENQVEMTVCKKTGVVTSIRLMNDQNKEQ